MKRTKLAALAALLLGLLGLITGAIIAPRAALAAYLGGFAYALTLVLGCTILVLIAHAAGARWMLVFRRIAELGAASTFVLLPAFLPVLVGAPLVYRWADSGRAGPWLNLPFFVVRTLAYFAVWIVISEILLRFSLRQDPRLPRTTTRLRAFAGASIWPIALTFSFASFDWFMSLDAPWISTMYPVYLFAGSILATLAMLGLFPLAEVNPSHRHALGKLVLTFVIFWAYIAFCQFMLIWIADLPHETHWFLVRMKGVWGALGILLIVGHFTVPFFLLLSRDLKRRRRFLVGIGSWLLFIHWVDVVWIIVPSADHAGEVHTWWLNFFALFFFAGLLAAIGLWRAGGKPLLAHTDPFFPDSLRYRTQ